MQDLWSSGDPRISALQRLTRLCVALATQSSEQVSNLSLPQMRMLLTVASSDGISGADAGRELGVSPSAVSRMADRLCSTGHLERINSPENRRVIELRLTEHGRTAVAEALDWREDLFTRALHHLGEHDEGDLAVTLQQLEQAIHSELHA